MKNAIILFVVLTIIVIALIQNDVITFHNAVKQNVVDSYVYTIPKNITKIELTYRPWDATRPPPIKKTITDGELINRIVDWINALPEPPKVQNGFADFGQGADLMCTTKNSKVIKITLEVAHRDIIVEEGQTKYVRFDQYSRLWDLLSNEVGVKNH